MRGYLVPPLLAKTWHFHILYILPNRLSLIFLLLLETGHADTQNRKLGHLTKNPCSTCSNIHYLTTILCWAIFIVNRIWEHSEGVCVSLKVFFHKGLTDERRSTLNVGRALHNIKQTWSWVSTFISLPSDCRYKANVHLIFPTLQHPSHDRLYPQTVKQNQSFSL